MTVVDVAFITGLTEAAIRAKIQRDEIKYVKFGNRVLICKQALDTLLGELENE
ncbi:MAG: helix-turn-helix domain-containing protein [Bacteroidetes bacterium]|nr:helix-turn-helix domain-containing protein [Bacteroidota bacterium]